MFTRSFATRALAALAVFAFSSSSFAAGFEKTIAWSGKWTGAAGAATAAATGAESLYFNPAGLAGAAKNDVSVNFDPTFSTFKSGVANAASQQESEQQFSPIYSGTASYRINDKLGVGLGAYVAGGSVVSFENIGGAALNDLKTDLSMNEISLGAGYEIMPGLRFGAAYRVNIVNLELINSFNPGTGIHQLRWSDMKKTTFDSYRLGMQYDAKTWGVGITYRAKAKFTVEGTQAVENASGAESADGTLSSELPQQLNVGAFVDVTDKLRILPEYSFTNYKDVNEIHGTTQLTDTQLQTGATNIAVGGIRTAILGAFNKIKTNWQNQHIARLGVEYTGITNYIIRAGYAYTSQVVPANRAKPTFSSPGTANTFTLGAGRMLGESMMINVAGEYAMASGKVSAAEATAAGAPMGAGTHETAAYAAHVGFSYMY